MLNALQKITIGRSGIDASKYRLVALKYLVVESNANGTEIL